MKNKQVDIKIVPQPVAFVLYVPSKIHLQRDPAIIKNACEFVKQGVEFGFKVYAENPFVVHISNRDLSETDKKRREINLAAIADKNFAKIVLAGESICEYAREVIQTALKANVDIILDADQESYIAKYLHLLQKPHHH